MTVGVPQFTLEDFSTARPYEFLAGMTGSKFQKELAVQAVKDQAAKLGFKAFSGLWKAFNSGEKAEKPHETGMDFGARIKLPDGLTLRPGDYQCSKDGVAVANALGLLQTVCPHPIAPVRRYVNPESGEEYLDVWFAKDNGETVVTKVITISKDDIANGLTKYAKYGIVVSRTNLNQLSAYLLNVEQANYDRIPEQMSVSRLGWVGEDNDFSPYVDHIHFDGMEDYGNLFRAVDTSGSEDVWVEAMRKVRAEKTPARMVLAASFASALIEPLGILPFIFHSWGGTGNGKTVSLMMAASVWANPAPGEYITSYNSTNFALETTAAFLHNLPLCLDELQIQASQGKADYDGMIYRLCEGVSRKQGTATGGLRKQRTWNNAILSTGEHPIIKDLSAGGALGRVLEVEAPGKAYSDLIGISNLVRCNYGWAGKKFIAWLQEPGNMDKVRSMYNAIYAELSKDGRVEKQAGSAAAILTADRIATDIIFQDNNGLTQDDLIRIISDKSASDVNQRAYDWLLDYVSANSNHFDASTSGEIWGTVIAPDPTKSAPGEIYMIKSVFDREFASHNQDSKAFLAWARRNGKIRGDQGRTDTKRSIPGTVGRCRCVCVLFDGEQPEEKKEEIKQNELPF
jgi:hypothetical protein